MKTAVVTGAAGFVGSYLCCELLENHYKVIALFHNQEPTLFQKIARKKHPDLSAITWVKADILDPEELQDAFNGADVVFHCAAKVSFESGDIGLLMETNVTGTKNVVNACLSAGVPSLVFASSVAALGRKGRDNEINENTEWVDGKFNSPYAVSKYQAELEVWRGMEEGLRVAIINPGVILGSGDGKSGSNMIFSHIKKGRQFYPTGINGFVGVDDVCGLMRLVYEKEIFGKRILAVAENVPFKKILDMAADTLGMKAPSVPFSGLIYRTAYFVARFCEFLHIPFPYPSAGIKSTYSISYYRTVQQDIAAWFSYTPLEQVMRQAVSDL